MGGAGNRDGTIDARAGGATMPAMAASNVQPGSARRRVTAMAATLIALLAAGWLVWLAAATRHDRRALALLDSPDPNDRRAAAAIVGAEHAPRALAVIRQQLAATEDPRVREGFVHALGQAGLPADFARIAPVALEDRHPYVRYIAWIAAARTDPARFRSWAADATPQGTPWDAIGRAAGWLELADTRGVADLLRWAAAGNAGQRTAACAVLYRGIGPLLESAGRWPVIVSEPRGGPWPPPQVALVARRCAEVELQRVADEVRPHRDLIEAVRHGTARVTRARERLARRLIGE